MKLKALNSIACIVAVLAAHAGAHATQISFNETTCQSGAVTAGSLTCTTSSAGTNYSASMSGWSTSGSFTGKFGAASMVYYPSSGVGINAWNESTAGSQHAVDNSYGTDAFLINFGSLDVALNQLSIGWRDGDADVSILRYTGAEAPLLGNRTVADLKYASGWEWVGDYSTLTTSTTLNFNNSGTVKTASWWLVSAYNSAYSGNPASGNLSNGDDYFKLSGFAGNVVAPTPTPTPPGNPVPEPGTFALIGIALAGLAAARRRRSA